MNYFRNSEKFPGVVLPCLVLLWSLPKNYWALYTVYSSPTVQMCLNKRMSSLTHSDHYCSEVMFVGIVKLKLKLERPCYILGFLNRIFLLEYSSQIEDIMITVKYLGYR